jgi:signal transduction histidine kinase
LGLWTLLVVVALWYLLRADSSAGGPPGWVIHGSDPSRSTSADRVREWFHLIHFNFQRIYPWVLFGPYVIWFTSRFHLDGPRFRWKLLAHVVAAAAFVAASTGITMRLSSRVHRVLIVTSHQETGSGAGAREVQTVRVQVAKSGPGPLLAKEDVLVRPGPDSGFGAAMGPSPELQVTNLLPRLEEALRPPPSVSPLTLRPLAVLMDTLAYGALAGVAHAVLFYRRYRDRERRALFLESNLAKARLHALQAQLQPHFLFNALNAIATLLRRDPRAAEATLMSLSELLRLALSQADQQEIPLRQELLFLERYMEIQQTRFGPRLSFERDVQAETLDCLVPTLLLQPLAENAIRHGLEPSASPGAIWVTSLVEQGRLRILLEDNGVGLGGPGASQPTSGIGLANLQSRLNALYGTEHVLELAARPGGGTRVRIELPLRQAIPRSESEPAPAHPL